MTKNTWPEHLYHVAHNTTQSCDRRATVVELYLRHTNISNIQPWSSVSTSGSAKYDVIVHSCRKNLNGFKSLPPAPALQLTSSLQCIHFLVTQLQHGHVYLVTECKLRRNKRVEIISYSIYHCILRGKQVVLIFLWQPHSTRSWTSCCSEWVRKGKKENYFHHFRINYTWSRLTQFFSTIKLQLFLQETRRRRKWSVFCHKIFWLWVQILCFWSTYSFCFWII